METMETEFYMVNIRDSGNGHHFIIILHALWALPETVTLGRGVSLENGKLLDYFNRHFTRRYKFFTVEWKPLFFVAILTLFNLHKWCITNFNSFVVIGRTVLTPEIVLNFTNLCGIYKKVILCARYACVKFLYELALIASSENVYSFKKSVTLQFKRYCYFEF